MSKYTKITGQPNPGIEPAIAPWSGATAASFFDASEDCVKIVSVEGDLLAMNANGICLMEVDDFARMRGKPWASLWPEPERGQINTAVAHALQGRGSKFYADCPTAKGTLKSWEVTVWPVLDDAGRATQLISISRDITDRKRAEAERALVASELAHRIKNMFAVVDGVISMSSRGVEGAKPFADTLRNRLNALGRAMAYVAPPEGAPANDESTLHGLLDVLLCPYGLVDGPEQAIFLTGDDVVVMAGAVTPIALVINELATNAMKYGALGADGGRVDVEIAIDSDTVRLQWRETLSGDRAQENASAQPQSGFGSTLLENTVIRQMRGTVRRDWSPNGLILSLEFPLDRIAPA
jgi:two-component sensor histidine kinase